MLLCEAFDVLYKLSLIAWVEETLMYVGFCTRRSLTLVVFCQSSMGNMVFLSNFSIRKRFSLFQRPNV
jgi:hypothetical protein